jgi:hypothetical protein
MTEMYLELWRDVPCGNLVEIITDKVYIKAWKLVGNSKWVKNSSSDNTGWERFKDDKDGTLVKSEVLKRYI